MDFYKQELMQEQLSKINYINVLKTQTASKREWLLLQTNRLFSSIFIIIGIGNRYANEKSFCPRYANVTFYAVILWQIGNYSGRKYTTTAHTS